MNKLLVGTVFGMLLFASSAIAKDVIYLKDGSVLGESTEIEVISDDMSGASYKVKGGGKGTQDLDKIDRIEYGDIPTKYENGIKKLEEGDYKAAIIALTSVLKAKKGRQKIIRPKVQMQYVIFAIAKAYDAAGKSNKALENYEKLAAKGSSVRFLPEALGGKIRILVSQDKLVNAKTAIKDAKKFRSLKAMSTYFSGRIKELEGKFSKAAADYKVAANSKGEWSLSAQLGLARCMLEEGKPSKVLSAVARVLDASPTHTQEAEALVVAGRAYISQGENDKSSFKDSLLTFERLRLEYSDIAANEAVVLWGLRESYKGVEIEGKKADMDKYYNRYKKLLRTKYPDYVE